MKAPDFKLGTMKTVLIARREKRPDPDSAGYIDVLTNVRQVKAHIRPIGVMAYMNGVQTGYGVTHKITLRWPQVIDAEDVIVRSYTLPDGSDKQDVYKLLRWYDVDGAHRWIEAEATLEGEQRA